MLVLGWYHWRMILFTEQKESAREDFLILFIQNTLSHCHKQGRTKVGDVWVSHHFFFLKLSVLIWLVGKS